MNTSLILFFVTVFGLVMTIRNYLVNMTFYLHNDSPIKRPLLYKAVKTSTACLVIFAISLVLTIVLMFVEEGTTAKEVIQIIVITGNALGWMLGLLALNFKNKALNS